MTNKKAYGLPTTKKEKNRFRPLPIFITVMIFFVLGNWCASQIFAHVFDYQAVLGGKNKLYAPWAWWGWYQDYGNQYQEQFKLAVSAGILITGLPLMVLALAITLGARKTKRIGDLHGSSHWATEEEIKDTALLNEKGVYVGGWVEPKAGAGKVRYLRHNGPEHIIAFAPTRSGKGVGLVLPTLLSWEESAVVLDIKGENYALTSGWRKKYANNTILRCDFSNPTDCARYNPLAEIRIGTSFEVGDAQNLATIIVDPKGEGLKSHWDKTSFDLLTGIILHACYMAIVEGKTPTLPQAGRMLSDPERTIEVLLNEMLTYPHVDGKPHYVIASSARDMLDKPEQEAGSVVSTAKSFLSLFKDPVVAANVSASDFRIRDLMNADNPVTLYLVINPADKERLKPLIRTLITQMIRILVEKMEFKDGRSVKHYKHRLLLLLDEFPSFGKMEILEEALAYMAGYGLKAYLIAQDKEQITADKAYGRSETVTSNCHIRIAYAPNKPETAEYLSKLCGDTTVVKESTTVSGKRTGVYLGNVSTTDNEHRRPLLTPDECMRLPGAKKNANGDILEAGDMLIIVSGFAPIYGKQILYFLDPTLIARARVPALEQTERLGGNPFDDNEIAAKSIDLDDEQTHSGYDWEIEDTPEENLPVDTSTDETPETETKTEETPEENSDENQKPKTIELNF